MYMQERENDENCVVVAKIDNVKSICSILKALHFSQEAVCFFSRDGLKITVEVAKCVQASAFIQLDVFQEFVYNNEDEQLVFKVDFHTLVECLTMFEASGMSTTVDMRIQGHGQPLLLLREEDGVILDCSLKTEEPDEITDFSASGEYHRLEEDGVILDCSIKTQEPDEMADFSFSEHCVPNKIILRSEFLKEIVDELDSSSELIGIELSSQYPYFRFFTSSRLGESEFQVDHQSDMIEFFDCKTRTAFRYRFDHLKHIVKAIAVSQKVSLRMDDQGLLCFQCMMKMEDGQICFVEYYCIQTTGDDGCQDSVEPADEFTLPEPF